MAPDRRSLRIGKLIPTQSERIAQPSLKNAERMPKCTYRNDELEWVGSEADLEVVVQFHAGCSDERIGGRGAFGHNHRLRCIAMCEVPAIRRECVRLAYRM